MPDRNAALDTALRHIRYLSESIGGRGSCTASEAHAAEYLASEMRSLGIQDVRLDRFRAARSTYRPYALAFIAGLIGTLLVWSIGDRWGYALAALFNALGAWGMLAETDFTHNWMRMLLPKDTSQNTIGLIPPRKETKHQVVLSAHIDTHRTPIFYSSTTWQKLFSVLVGGAFASMALSALLYTLGALLSWEWVRWPGLIAAAMQVFALSMTLHADLTPFSPGANDDASGIGVTLAIAEQLRSQTLMHTQVWLAFTGCEEAASYGILDLIQRHEADLGRDAVYIVNDQVAAGCLSYILTDGLIKRYPAHPVALALARQARQELPHLQVVESHGSAYTDATPATRHGYRAITLVANPPPGSNISTHWHQMSDTIENIDPRTLQDAITFTWQLLQIIDRTAADLRQEFIPHAMETS
jgi:hypothetical protein